MLSRKIARYGGNFKNICGSLDILKKMQYNIDDCRCEPECDREYDTWGRIDWHNLERIPNSVI